MTITTADEPKQQNLISARIEYLEPHYLHSHLCMTRNDFVQRRFSTDINTKSQYWFPFPIPNPGFGLKLDTMRKADF